MGTGIIKCHSGNGCIRSWTHSSIPADDRIIRETMNHVAHGVHDLIQGFVNAHIVQKSDWRGSSRKQPRGLQLSLLAQPVMVAQPVGVGAVSLGGPASGRWHGKSWWPSQWALAR